MAKRHVSKLNILYTNSSVCRCFFFCFVVVIAFAVLSLFPLFVFFSCCMCVLPWLSVLFYLFRDIYYEDVALWGNQPVLDSTVTQMTKLLNIPRCCLNIGATSKGLVAGSLNFLDGDGKLIDCQTPTGMRAFFFLKHIYLF